MKSLFNFEHIVDQISAGALDIHDPAIKHLDSLNPDFKTPNFYGDRQAKYTVGMVFREDIALSQDWILFNSKSLGRAIAVLCPKDGFNQYAEQYLKSPYFETDPLKTMMVDIGNKIGSKISEEEAAYFDLYKDKMWSGITDDRRRVSDRQLFTHQEQTFTKNLCKIFPELAYSLVIYQSIFVSYFEALQANIEQKIASDGPTQPLQNALVAINNLRQFRSINNMMQSVLPAVALMYAKNHYQYPEDIDKLQIDPSCPPNIQDISEGVEFAFKKGAFTHTVGDRTSICPASNALIAYSSTRLQNIEPAEAMESVPHKSNADKSIWPDDMIYPLDEDVFNHKFGSMIYSIYKTIHFNPLVKEKLQNPTMETAHLKSPEAPSKEQVTCPFFRKP